MFFGKTTLYLKVNKTKVLAHIAQVVEHVLGKDEVGGSSPLLGLPQCLQVDEVRYESGWW